MKFDVSDEEKAAAIAVARQVVVLQEEGMVPPEERDAVVCAVVLVNAIDELMDLRAVADSAARHLKTPLHQTDELDALEAAMRKIGR